MKPFLMKLFSVSFIFGVITMISGLIGVPLGSYLAQRLRVNYPRADAYICACGLIGSAPVLFAASLYATHSAVLCYILIFIGEVMLNMNWSIVADILLVSSTTLLMGFFLFQNQFNVWYDHDSGRSGRRASGRIFEPQAESVVSSVRRGHLFGGNVPHRRRLVSAAARDGQLVLLRDLHPRVLGRAL